jgi:predicted PurR-regulated permease PerM
VVPPFAAQLPALGRSLTQSAGQLDRLLQRLPFTGQDANIRQLAERAVVQLSGPGGLVSLLGGAASVLAGFVLLVVVLFFYLAQGRWLVSSVTSQLPEPRRAQADELLDRLWVTVGAYFRSLLLVALFDATLVGIGLVLLGVPLALPLAVLVYIGAFFPFIGATVSGLLAVLVAFADGGLWLAIAVLALVLGVQFLEGNVVEPLVMGKLIRLPALVVLLAIAAGATLLGVFGAFIAAPAVAAVERVGEFLRERRPASTA